MQAKIEKDKFFDIKWISSDNFSDNRGNIEKIFSNFFKINEITITFAKKGSIRGMHFQISKPQAKIIKVIDGEILDICIDLRKKSKTYLKVFSKILKSGDSILIPRGYAHGFQAIKNSRILMIYSEKTISKYSRGYSYKSNIIKNLWIKDIKKIVSKNDNLMSKIENEM